MPIVTKGKYNIALEDQGLMLQGLPDTPAYLVSQAPIYSNRFAQGDRTYNDFSFWWFWSQSDFSGGYKNEVIWQDDAKFFESEGVTVSEQVGSIRLNFRLLGTQRTVADKNIEYRAFADVGNEGLILYGYNKTDDKGVAWDIDDEAAPVYTSATLVQLNTAISADGDSVLIGARGTGGTSSLRSGINASTFVGAFANNVNEIVFYEATKYWYIMDDDLQLWKMAYGGTVPSSVAVASLFPPYTGNNNLSMFWNRGYKWRGRGMIIVGDRIYFTIPEGLGSTSWRSHLWAYDISEIAYVPIYTWETGFGTRSFIARDSIIYFFGTNATTNRIEIWKYSTTAGTMELLHKIGRAGETYTLLTDPVRDQDFIYFGVDDGSSDNQVWVLDRDDHVYSAVTPPSQFATRLEMLAMGGDGNLAIIKHDHTSEVGNNSIAYFDAIPKNDRQLTGYVKTSIHDADVPTIDKLYHSVTINFDTLVSGHSIAVHYSIDGGVTLTSLGTVAFTTDGAVNNKTFLFTDAIVAKTLMLKFILTGNGGTDTPALNDFSCKFVPMTNYAKTWTVRINCGDDVLDLAGFPVPKRGRELSGFLEKAWLTKEILSFQDLEYANTQLNGALTSAATTITVDSTVDFPEVGRLLIDNEEILYTGKTPTTFTGCVRGIHGTAAASHLDNAAVYTGYNRVIITDFQKRVPILQRDKDIEPIITLSLREAGFS